MFELTDGCEPVSLGEPLGLPSLCPQLVSQLSYAKASWRKLVSVSHGCTETHRHRACLVLPETSLEVARPEHTDRAGVEEDGTTAACSAARLGLLRRFRNSNRAEFGDPRRCGRFRVKLLIDVSDHKCAPSSSPSSAFICCRLIRLRRKVAAS